MPEIRKYFRYIIPGITCTVLFCLIYKISKMNFCDEIFNQFKDVQDILAIVIGGFLASGGLGYIFAVFYHGLYNLPLINKIFAIDHRSAIEKIKIMNIEGQSVGQNNIKIREAWTIFTLYWNTKIQKKDSCDHNQEFLNRSIDMLHGIGTTIIGTIICIIIWACHLIYSKFENHEYVTGIILIMFIIFLFFNFCILKKSLQTILNSIFIEFINSPNGKNNKNEIYYIKEN